MTLDDLERPKFILAEKIVLRSPLEQFERRQTHAISDKILGDDSPFQKYNEDGNFDF